MKLALVSPKGVGMGTNKENTNAGLLYSKLIGIDSLKELMSCPNSPLIGIASLAKDYFDTIDYFDEEIKEIIDLSSYDIIAMSFMTQQASRAFEIAERYRDSDVYLIAGGMHPTNSPEETAKYFNSVFIGEAEVTWHSFMRDFNQGKPLKFYTNDAVIDMESVPMPDYSVLPIEQYRTIPIQISRGCPHNCDFCASTKVYGPKYRHKSVQQVLNEINYISSLKPYPHIYFTDDNMLVNSKFCNELLSNFIGMKFKWMTHTDISIADDSTLLRKLNPSGCRKIVIGFESIVPESLKQIEPWKFNRLNGYAESIKKIQDHGVGVWGTFIIGLDGDDTSVFQRVIDFTLDNNLFGAMISLPTPFPGSKFYNSLDTQGRILTKHWGSYTLWNVVVQPAQMTVEQLEKGFSRVLKEIYSEEAVYNRMNYFKKIYTNLINQKNAINSSIRS